MAILCERFTTSKLKTFEDLSTIGTYGFRGEALASISHIAHLSVTTRTKESSCAWRAHYADGKLAPPKPGQSTDPKKIAGRPGTQITVRSDVKMKYASILIYGQVEDLFYNVPTRRRAFRSASEEFAKVLDLVGRYAVHCTGVSFSCKKHGESSTAISVPSQATIIDRIRQVHGVAVSRELIEFKVSDDRWGFAADVIVSNANYSVKKTTLLLFINHRSVESSAIKKALEQLYSNFLPKGGHPFIYLSLEIEPQRVDVNVHPTKREVNFLNEDEIIEKICDEVRNRLSKVDNSRTFTTQTLITGMRGLVSTPIQNGQASTVPTLQQSNSTDEPTSKSTAKKRPYENNLVRTDAKERKITSMLRQQSSLGQAQDKSTSDGTVAKLSHQDSTGDYLPEYIITEKEPTICRLSSIKGLRADVREAMHNELTDIISTHSFVGIIDMQRRIAAIQGGVKLFLVDYGMLCNEYFYQVGLTDFGNFGAIRFDPPLRIEDLLSEAAKYEAAKYPENDDDDNFDWKEVVAHVAEQIVSMRELLSEYFSMEVTEEGDLVTIPLLMKGYMPCLAKLPQFLLRLGPHVNWVQEKECFHSFLCELASFYVPEMHENKNPEKAAARAQREAGEDVEMAEGEEAEVDETPMEDLEMVKRRAHVAHAIENALFPAFKNRLVATKGILSGVVEVADLKGLYRVFERC